MDKLKKDKNKVDYYKHICKVILQQNHKEEEIQIEEISSILTRKRLSDGKLKLLSYNLLIKYRKLTGP